MTVVNNGRIPPEGTTTSGPVRTGRVLQPLAEERRQRISEMSHDQLKAIRAGCAKELAKNFPVQYAPEPKVQANGKPFRVKSERKYFFSGERDYPKDLKETV